MTSGIDPSVPPEAVAPILWITGLSGVGKSTLARAMVQALRSEGQKPLWLDGDTVRDLMESGQEPLSHAPAQRLQRAWRIARMARWAALQGLPVIVSTISLRHEIHDWNRSGPAPYAEILLQADLDLLRRRKPDLYDSSPGAAPRHVVGLDIAAEYPRRAELRLQQRFAPEELDLHLGQSRALWNQLCQRQPT